VEETRCFYELGEDDDKLGNNVITIDKIAYNYQDFYPFSMENSICSVNYPKKTELNGKKFYEFVLDNNNIKNIKKVDILAGQNGFKVDDSFNIQKFVEKYGNGLEYKSKDEFNIYQISSFPDINVKVHKFIYNYLCYNTQVINYNIITTKINIGNIIDLPNNSVVVRPTNNGNVIATDIPEIDWSHFKNSNPNFREDKRQAIINALVARKKVLQDELKNKNKETATKLAKIKEKIIDNGVDNKYQLTKYIDTNSGKWNQDEFLNQFNAFNYKRHYLTKSVDATIDTTNVEVSIRIKNNFKEGLKWFKVDGYYNNNISYIKGKNQIESIHQLEGKDIKKFRGLNNLTNGKQNSNRNDTYSMMFSGYLYAHETGNYKFGTTSDDASHIFINDELVVDNGGTRGSLLTVEKDYGTIKKGDICKIDIYFGKNDNSGDNLEIYWRLNNSSRIYSSEWNSKTWIFYTDPDINPANNSSKIPTMKGNRQYVEGREHKLLYKTAQDNTGDIYYEFKNTDFIYDVIVNRDIDTRILVVGGGGGGGAFGGGGGGGGVLFKETEKFKTNDICTIRIGEGGNGAPIYNNGVNGNNGKDSSIKINNQEYIAKGGGGGRTGDYQSGRGGSGVVILRIANSPVNKLAKCNYYIPPLSEITSYLEKADVLESKINFEVRNAANPKSLFYSSYIYLKKGYYKFNFDIDTSSHDDLFVKSKIIIYDNKEKTNFISVYNDNMVTKKWVYIPDTNYYIFDISLVYISESSYNIPFKIKARYTNGEKSNKLEFSNAELNIDNYETISDANKFKDMSYYIYYHDNDYLSGIKDVTSQYNKDFNSFLESYYLLNDSFGYVINYFKLLGKTNNEIKSDTNIQKIDKLIEYLTNIDLKKYLDSSDELKLKENNSINNIFAKNTITNINDYITFNQYRQEDKDILKGIDNTFNMISHGPRSLYIELF
jgi:hypothetical protein